MIVVEGVDNSGKSTLITHLITTVLKDWGVQLSEGPPKWPGEQNERVRRYLDLKDKIIFDRHPCVSQLIYGQLRTHSDEIDIELIKQFYARRPLFIYCDGGSRGMSGHRERATVDTASHLAAVNANYKLLLESYRRWAIEHATIWYRIGDDMDRVAHLIYGYLHGDNHVHQRHQGIPREVRA